MRRLLAALTIVLALAPGMGLAVNPSEVLSDPVLETRAREISAELRCLVCQNQSIDDSDADLAHDLRVLVRERLTAGDSDAEVLQYVVDRYGEFVLLKPVLAVHTILLWIAAPLVLLIGLAAIVIGVRRKRPVEAEAADLTAEEKAALEGLEK